MWQYTLQSINGNLGGKITSDIFVLAAIFGFSKTNMYYFYVK